MKVLFNKRIATIPGREDCYIEHNEIQILDFHHNPDGKVVTVNGVDYMFDRVTYGEDALIYVSLHVFEEDLSKVKYPGITALLSALKPFNPSIKG